VSIALTKGSRANADYGGFSGREAIWGLRRRELVGDLATHHHVPHPPMNPRVISQPLTTNALASEALAGNTRPDWYEQIPRDAAAWTERIDAVRSDSPRDWLSRLADAFDARGKARDRLEASADGRGVVVTTGQQPGLFG